MKTKMYINDELNKKVNMAYFKNRLKDFKTK